MREIPLDSPELDEILDYGQKDKLMEEIELLDGASADFDQELVDKGELTPVFFGSALTNFGVEIFLKHFLSMTTPPLPRKRISVSSIRSKKIFLPLCSKFRPI